jgi:peptide chain release factor 2
MRKLESGRKIIKTWRTLQTDVDDLIQLAKLSVETGDTSVRAELETGIQTINSSLEELETRLMFKGDYDSRNAILELRAGAGGTESQDWAQMLMRMYLRWAERHGFRAEILDESPGEEAGIKSATIEINGDYAYGFLRSEHGVHRLVRLSPFNADHARHTSFALVEVMPEAEGDADLIIKPEELKIEAFRSSGPGGQNMQKTSSAIRVTHIPTGLIASCQSQRSQTQNKESALKVLYARLLEIEETKKEAERARLKGKRIEAGWGNQIRSYVLHPYKMVKDLRTDHETGDPNSVLDGGLDDFMLAYLRSQIGDSR